MFIAHIPVGLALAKIIMRRKLSKPIIALAAIGAVFPDFDLIRFYAFDNGQTHHHEYWTHLPAFWVGALGCIYMFARLLGKPLHKATLVFFVAAISHLLLDSLAGEIRWAWPLTKAGFHFVSVPATHSPWYMSFIHHWTFKLEIIISFICLWVAFRKD